MLMKTPQQSLTEQLVQHYTEQIGNRLLAPGARLPSVRRCARLQGVSASTVVAAYDRLLAQGLIEARIADIEDKLSRAEVIDISKLSGDTVTFGAKVTLIDEETEAKVAYQIVGEFEADVKKGKISVSSPIARAIIGKRKGDSVEVNTPGGGKSYEIARVAWA